LHWELFTVPCVLVVVIALATVSVQALRAAIASPIRSLRAD